MPVAFKIEILYVSSPKNNLPISPSGKVPFENLEVGISIFAQTSVDFEGQTVCLVPSLIKPPVPKTVILIVAFAV
jgi:hypothetical protein